MQQRKYDLKDVIISHNILSILVVVCLLVNPTNSHVFSISITIEIGNLTA